MRVVSVAKNFATLTDENKEYQLPYKEMKGHLIAGREVLVITTSDETVSMKIYNHLIPTTHYKVGDKVDAIVYEIKDEMGAFVAVNDYFHGLIPLNELYKEIKVGSSIRARITKITDGKLRLSIREKAKDQIDIDIKVIENALESGDGILFLDDDSEPEIIKKKLNLSKKAFKRAIGRMLKEEKIEFIDGGIRKIFTINY